MESKAGLPNVTWSLTRIGVLVVLFCFAFLCNAIAGSEQKCVCSGVPCEKNTTAADCPAGRVILRRDCFCCSVCAKQLTEECNDQELSCDFDFGLVCGSDGKCKADKSCVDDTECSTQEFCSGGGCADPCKISPDVCKKAELTNGICVVRNHRAQCSCANGQSVNSNKECVSSAQPEALHCAKGGRQLDIGEKLYTQKCGKICECQRDGILTCRDVEGTPICPPSFVPMSIVSGEMSEACKILIGNETAFDGCCVPETCRHVTSQDEQVKGSRDFKLSEALNNLGDEDEEADSAEHQGNPREMLLAENEDRKIDEHQSSMKTSSTSKKNSNSIKQNPSTDANDAKKQLTVTVLSKTTNTAAVHLPMNDKEAILAIALSSELNNSTETKSSSYVWKEHRIPSGLLQLILSDLMADTSYTVKYTVGDQTYPFVQFQTAKSDTDEKETKKTLSSIEVDATEKSTQKSLPEPEHSSEEDTMTELPTVIVPEEHDNDEMKPKPKPINMSSTTEKINESVTVAPVEVEVPVTVRVTHPPKIGCTFNGTNYDVGHILLDGCDQKCECMKNRGMKCMERCIVPFFKKGSFAHDKLCFEEPSGSDECCVIVECARATARELTINPCDSVKCGQNAECRYEMSPVGLQNEHQNQETLCVCKEGFLGHPYDDVKGCESGVTPTMASSALATSSQQQSNVKPTAIASTAQTKVDGCRANNRTYEFGEEHADGCNYKCHCETSGEFLCRPRCNYRRDEEVEIPKGCEVKKDSSDPECCETLICAGETLDTIARKEKQTVPTDGCVYKNKTYERDEKFFDGCEQQCMCFSNGDITCQPRCPPAGPSSTLEKECVTLPDPIDHCCTVTICGNSTVISDVMKAAANKTKLTTTTTEAPTTITVTTITTTERGRILKDESNSEESLSSEDAKTINSPLALSLMVLPFNETSMMVSIRIQEDRLPSLNEQKIVIRYTADLSTWQEVEAKIKELFVEGSEELHTIVGNLTPGKKYFFKVEVNGTVSHTVSGYTKSHRGLTGPSGSGNDSHESGSEEDHSSSLMSGEEAVCNYKNKFFGAAEEFYDGCESYCVCETNGSVQCVPIECPNDFGLELLDSQCVKWEPILENFQKDPPNCCPEMKCVQNSSCTYEGGIVFENFEELPRKLTGCGKRCYCEYGNITCQNVCPPVGDIPPASLPCPPDMATRISLPPENCCQAWVCDGHNNTDGPKIAYSPSHPQVHQQDTNTYTNKKRPTNPTPATAPHHPNPIHHLVIDDEDQFIPPSTGNQPSVVGLDNIHPQQLEELLHQLSTLGEHGGPNADPFTPRGTYFSVKNPQEIRELERTGAKVIGQGEDGNFIFFIPSNHQQIPGLHQPQLQPHQTQTKAPTFHDPRPRPHPINPTGPTGHFPGHFGPNFPGPNAADEIGGVMIRPLNDSTLHIDFTVSPVLVGLQGAVEVLYTREFKNKPNPDQWERQVFQQPEDIIDNSHLQLFLTGLYPNSEYHIQIQVMMSDLHNTPTSDIFVVRTPPSAPPTTTLPPEISVDPSLKLVQVTSSTAEVSWKKLTSFEESLTDGVQIKYKAYDDQFYLASPLIHRSISNFTLTNLHPGTKYEVDLLFLPFMNQTTELKSGNPIHINTPTEVDDFSFTIALSSGKITEQTVELLWEGVTFPEDKFVNIYQVIYRNDEEKEQKNTFKVAKRELSKKATITDLKPGTKYQIWLEAFLTNGKKKISNVINIQTKAGTLPAPEKSEQDQLAKSSRSGAAQESTSYYGALIALAIVAALSIVGIVVLLMILIKKQNQSKIPINDRKSESSYDNPSFKNYDIEANGHSKPSEL